MLAAPGGKADDSSCVTTLAEQVHHKCMSSEKQDHETLNVLIGIKINYVMKANFLIMMGRGIGE